MSTASVGRAREHRVSAAMGREGWVQIARSAGSKGPADLVMAHHRKGIALVQVGGPGKKLGPDDRARLRFASGLCRATPVLARVMPRAGIEWFVVGPGKPATWTEFKP